MLGKGFALIVALVAHEQPEYELEGGARVGRGHEGSYRGKSPRWGGTGNEVSRLLGMLSWITKSFDSMILKRGGEMYIYR